MSAPARSSAIERIDAPTWERLEREYIDRNRPVVITGVVPKWRAFTAWTPAYLKQTAGEVRVEVSYDERADHGGAHRTVRELATRTSWREAMQQVNAGSGVPQQMPFGELVDRLTAEPPDKRYILSHYPLTRVSPALLDDLDHDRWIHGGHTRTAVFFGHDQFSPQHYHGTEEAILSLIFGRKRVVMFPPDQIRNLYPYPWHTPMLNFAQVDDRAPDYRRFPRFQKAKPVIVDLEAGEMLFIPLHWFHSVTATGYAFVVTWFWPARLRNYRFPTPSLQVGANLFFSPLMIGENCKRAARFLRRKIRSAR